MAVVTVGALRLFKGVPGVKTYKSEWDEIGLPQLRTLAQPLLLDNTEKKRKRHVLLFILMYLSFQVYMQNALAIHWPLDIIAVLHPDWL